MLITVLIKICRQVVPASRENSGTIIRYNNDKDNESEVKNGTRNDRAWKDGNEYGF